MKKSVLITGGTGSLGVHIVDYFLKQKKYNVAILVRSKGKDSAKNRIKKIFSSFYKNKKKASEQVDLLEIFDGDLKFKNLGIRNRDLKILQNKLNLIFHVAASTKLDASDKEAYLANVSSTKNICEFAASSKGLEKFIYVSSVFIAGRGTSVFSESNFNLNQSFGNAYEKSKFFSEKTVREYFNSRYSTLIFRPGVLMGSRYDGFIRNFNVLYIPIKFFINSFLDTVPINLNTFHNILPVDSAAKAICLLSLKERGNKVFHVINPKNTSLIEYLNFSAEFFKYKNPKFISIEDFKNLKLTPVQKLLVNPLLHYFNYTTVFKANNFFKALKKFNISMPEIKKDYLYRVLKYAKLRKFKNLE